MFSEFLLASGNISSLCFAPFMFSRAWRGGEMRDANFQRKVPSIDNFAPLAPYKREAPFRARDDPLPLHTGRRLV